jgi:hypothetical protein
MLRVIVQSHVCNPHGRYPTALQRLLCLTLDAALGGKEQLGSAVADAAGRCAGVVFAATGEGRAATAKAGQSRKAKLRKAEAKHWQLCILIGTDTYRTGCFGRVWWRGGLGALGRCGCLCL